MICGETNCYSNCQIDNNPTIPFELSDRFGSLCDKCNHSLWNHHRWCIKWAQLVDTQVSVDQDMKKKWETAKDEKEMTAALIETQRQVLHDLDQAIARDTDNLEQLVKRYARLSLSGSFATQVASAVRLLEQKFQSLGGKGVSIDQFEQVMASLKNMRRKLELLKNARRGVDDTPAIR